MLSAATFLSLAFVKLFFRMPSPYTQADVAPQRQRVHHHPVPLIRKEEGGLRGVKLSYALAVHLLHLRLD